MPSIVTEIQKNRSRVFRRAKIKRRLATTGLFETSWLDISKDVKKWGRLSRSVDDIRHATFRVGDLILQVANDEGKYNPEDDEASLWYGYANQQRTLVKVEAGFQQMTQSSAGVWTVTEYPADPTVFVGIIAGDVLLSDKNEVSLPVKPLTQLFRDFPCAALTGFTATGMTASQFITMVRDQQDTMGTYVFRPFLGDTTGNWDIATTSHIYYGINTSTAEMIRDLNVWDAIERLAETDDMVTYVKNNGTFFFGARDANTTVAQHVFAGANVPDYGYGNTILKINSYGKKMSKFYSRVEVKWQDVDTYTSTRITQTAFQIGGSNSAWNLGLRTYKLENFWIQTATVADAIAGAIHTNVSTLKNELEFTATFTPHLELLDRVEMNYDSSSRNLSSRWDIMDWSDAATETSNLYWDNSRGDAIRFDSKPFKLLSIDLDLDKLETKFIAQAL